MNSIQISIKANEQEQELLISQLSDLDAIGFEQIEDRLIAYFPANDFNSYEVTRILNNYEFVSKELKEQNWNEVWEHNFQPVAVQSFCGIRADFHKPFTGIEHEIIITPKMSFGTGHHATTYMMIDQMKDLDFKNKSVFDFGTGTGILSILAEKLGAREVVAIDVDEWSIENTNENIEKNNCKRIVVSLSSKLPSQKFEIVLANINRNVILDYIKDLKKILKPGAHLLLSGLLTSDETIIIEACKTNDLELLKKTERNNWISLLLANK
ncbi:MAG TPA: 50S ribosomal protein L11 methyltransferase [Flavisolibacter sp.]|nr:50S ribosomal protein L11 methyltransferase [Flavisolibacter sp.]